MNRFFNFVGILLLTIFLAVSAFAQKQPSKDEWFKEIAKLTNTKKPEDRAKAYQMSKDFLAQYGKDADDKVKKIRDYLINYRLGEFNRACDETRMNDALAFGKEILADEPENSYVTLNLAYAGYEAYTKKQDKSFGPQAIDYAQKTLAFFEAGKLPKEFLPFKDQAEATALMYYVLGTFSIEKDIKQAAINFYKAVQFESQIKKTSYPFYIIAFYYERRYEELSLDFQKKHGAKTTADAAMKTDMETIEKVIDLMLDAYARAVKLGEAENNPSREGWKDRLTQVYKFRKGNDTGLADFLGSILTKPMTEPN